MIRLRRELDVFRLCPRSMRVLMLSNMIYALLLPVIEVFVAAYVMRNSRDVGQVFTYQLAVYTATPAAFFLNGILLGRIPAKHLYAAGMVLSGLAMVSLMRTVTLTSTGIAIAGLIMGLATGLFWANRGFLALATTQDSNRNYYYGFELFVAMLASVLVPALIGWFLSGTMRYGWLDGLVQHAYHLIAVAFLILTAAAAVLLEQGSFASPARTRFLFARFHPLWRSMQRLALLKGLAQGYMLTAPAMLILLLVGQEGTLGLTQSIGGILAAAILYTVGRTTSPRHRQLVFAVALSLFFLGSVANALLFNTAGVLIFLACLLLAKPLLDLGYNPIELRVIDAVSSLEQRSQYAYLFNHDLALFAGRALGCLLFLAIARWVSGIAALRYAMPVVALLQMLSIAVARQIHRRLALPEFLHRDHPSPAPC